MAPTGRAHAPALGLSLALLWAPLAGCGGEPAERVVLVTIDTLRADHVGAYGAAPSPTPHLDALAERGVRFETAISPTPLTLPSHATLLTGRDPPAHGVRHNGVFRLAEDVPSLAERLRERGFATAAFVGAFVLDRSYGLDRGFDVYDDHMALDGAGRGASYVAERRGDRVVDAALAWLAEAPPRFFLWVHLYDPHADYHPPEPFLSRFGDDAYRGEVAFADAQLGRLLGGLDDRFPAGSAVVVTSDHGESLGDHGEPTHSYSLYDATQHVPLLLRAPGLPEGVRIPGVVALRDVAPTLLELAGAPPLEGAEGASLLPLVRGDAGAPRTAYLETVAPKLDWGMSPLLGVRDREWKYVRAPRPELYALADDPAETENLAASRPERVAALDALLEERLRDPHAGTARTLGAGDRERLEALGYVVPEGAPLAPAELTAIGGEDPKDGMQLVRDLNRANGLLASGDPEAALALLTAAGERGPGVSVLVALAALGVQDFALAREAAARAVRDAPGRSMGWVLLGRAEELGGDLGEAERLFSHARGLDAGAGTPHTGLGRIDEARGDPAAAAAHYRAALGARAPDPEARYRLAAVEIEQGRRVDALELLADLPTRVLTRPETAIRLAEAELSVGRPDLALPRTAAALDRHPDSVTLRIARADALEAAGRPAEALALLERTAVLKPSSTLATNRLAWALAQRGQDLERAERLARAAVEASGAHPGAVDTLALVHLAKARPAEALALADEALPRARGENASLLHYRRAEALARLGRVEEARAARERARELREGRRPSYAAAERRLADALGEPGD